MTSLAEIESVIVILENPPEVFGVKAQKTPRWTAMFQFYEQHRLRRNIAANACKCLTISAKVTLTFPLRRTNGDPCIYFLFS